MKKIVKKLLFVVILLAVPFIIVSTNVYADINPNTYSPSGSIDKTTVVTYGSKLYKTLGVIAIMILGLKLIIASATERAEYKKYMVPIVIGIFIIASISSIVTILSGIGDSINNEGKQMVEDEFIEQKQQSK